MSYLEFSWVFAVIIFSILIKWLFKLITLVFQLPPGPWGLPFVGYVPWISKKGHEDFMKIAKKYGGMFSVTLGCDTVVVLNDWPSIKASLLDQPKIFTGRPASVLDHIASRRDLGSIDGPVWAKQRALATQCLKNSGMGKKSMEVLMMDSVNDVMETLSQYDGKIFMMNHVFFGPLMKTNWKMIANQEIESDDKEFQQFDEDIRDLFKELRADNPINAFPWLRFIPPNGFGFKKMMGANQRIMALLTKIINSHMSNWIEGSEDDVIDHYINRIKKKEAITTQTQPPFNSDHLLGSVWTLFTAGVDTTNSSILWGLLFIAHNPEVQKKAQRELDAVVGRERLPSIDDFSRLPYMKALIMEVHRLASVVPLSISHSNTKTTTLNGFTIPKGTTCIQNIYAVHHDPSLWDEPERFNPERFLLDTGEVKIPPYLMPFSVGPRTCIGQPLAEMELKLIFGCLLHRFTFSLPKDRPKPTFDPALGIVIQPQPYSLLIHARGD